MKNIRLIQLIFIGLLTISTVSTQNKTKDYIYIKGVKFVSPLLEKWITEYGKVNPLVQIKIADKQTSEKEIDLNLFVNEFPADSLQPDLKINYVGRYALLPIASRNNLHFSDYTKKGINKKKLKELFFQKDLLAEDKKSSETEYPVTIYSGNTSYSGANSFATYFGYKPSEIKGKRISGDDIYLISAIKKDSNGVTFNNLSYIFDINTRQIKTDITLLPLDIKKEQREVLNSENIDQLIALLEAESIDLIPVLHIGFIYTDYQNPEVGKFLKWVLADGQKFNHTYGFLNPDKETLAYQKRMVDGVLLTSMSVK